MIGHTIKPNVAPLLAKPTKAPVLAKRTKAQVRAIIRKTGSFQGYLCGNRVNPWHITNGWHLGCAVAFTSEDDMVKQVDSFTTGLYVYTPQLGSYAHFYEIIEHDQTEREGKRR